MALQQFIVKTPDGQQQTVSVDLESQGLTPETYAARLKQFGIQFVGRGQATPQQAPAPPPTQPAPATPQMSAPDPRPAPAPAPTRVTAPQSLSVNGMDIFGSMRQQPASPAPDTASQFAPSRPPIIEEPTPPPSMSAPDPPIAPAPPAGTGGTPFLGFGVPGTTAPGTPGFVDEPGFWTPPPHLPPAPPPEVPPPAPPTPGATSTTIYNPALPQGPTVPGPGGLEYQGATGAAGNLLDPYDIPSIALPGAPQIDPTLDRGAQDRFTGLMNTLAGQVQQQYNYQNPAFTAAEMQRGDIPQPEARQLGQSPDLQRMLSGEVPVAAQTAISPELQQQLSGEGYNPSILAQMRARASEGVNQAGLAELSQSRRALEQAGLGGSPAGAAVAGDVARRSGMARSAALRDVDIANAEQGIQSQQFGIGQQTGIGLANTAAQNQRGSEGIANQRYGLGLQTQVGLSNMQAANQMAMENANRIFSGLSQNLENVQQARGAQFGAETERQGRQADATSNVIGQQGAQWQAAAANAAQNAPFQNAQNTLTRDWNQAQLERQRQQTNLGTRESRWQTAATGLPGFSPLPNSNFQNYEGYSPFNGG